ncbi:uncharacterized protein LY89DRAFT_784962 [Mollisia scopiformis]|uniref:F-box domain-containing protein n=1 Tax=Mollisia scopiformis TaxID=149040 RepID=A0A194WZS5_MOLSC|nr:uncharacterized protein LY89DRAFT_784962 [Mollisia scopiformis]KUJ13209.1 hypothetical protein LY89DRAFT_784962 [Mollisia scopiformis]
MTPAQNQVFALPEIVENILLQLPLRDLLVNAQRVCHGWNEVTKSPTLQQALFFEPSPQSQTTDPTFNPLLQEVFKPWFTAEQRKSRYNRGEQFLALDWNSSDAKREAYRKEEASWRRMLPIQPPATVFQIDAKTYSMGGTFRERGELTITDGVRMGVLYDYAYVAVACPISSFWVEWNMLPRVDAYDSDQFDVRGNSKEDGPMVTLHTRHTIQCCVDDVPDIPWQLESKGYKKLDIPSWDEDTVSIEHAFELNNQPLLNRLGQNYLAVIEVSVIAGLSLGFVTMALRDPLYAGTLFSEWVVLMILLAFLASTPVTNNDDILLDTGLQAVTYYW